MALTSRARSFTNSFQATFPYPKTAAAGYGMYSEVYQRLADDGADQVISMHIHSGLSNLSNTARLAAEAADKIQGYGY